MPVTARRAALDALTACRTRGARPELFLNAHGPEDRREHALAMTLVNGVLQNQICLDAVLAGCARDYAGFRPAVREILRLSAYQILFLDRVPQRAAVFEGVKLARETAPYAAGAVNAILRAVCRCGLPPVDGSARSLSVRYSHPEWLVRELLERYGPESCEKILMADNSAPHLTAQVNTLKITPRELRVKLEDAGVTVESCPVLDGALYLSGTGPLEELEAFREGDFYIQDAAARLAVMCAGARPGETVLDMCAAPGGKSFAAALDMENRGRILSFDIHEKKAALIRSGARRLGIRVITAEAGDARESRRELWETGDLVIADVPCSGMGVIRGKPEIRYKDPRELEGLPAVQLDILKSCANLVRPGGRLLYSTCTILRRENEDVAEQFLALRPDFALMPFTLPAPFGPCPGYRTILPHEGDTDGFFLCLMQRKI